MQDWYSKAKNIFAVMKHDTISSEPTVITFGDITLSEKLEKFVEDVRYVNQFIYFIRILINFLYFDRKIVQIYLFKKWSVSVNCL